MRKCFPLFWSLWLLFGSHHCWLYLLLQNLCLCQLECLHVKQKYSLTSRLWGLTENLLEQAWYSEFRTFQISSINQRITSLDDTVKHCVGTVLLILEASGSSPVPATGCSTNACDMSKIRIKCKCIWMNCYYHSLEASHKFCPNYR